ncbi:MAG: VanZ family protein [Gammaproteobacteria bacterium]
MPAVLILIALFIAYASLYPFEFATPVEIHLLPWLYTERWISRADVLANILLFVPYGFTVAFGEHRNKTRIWLLSAGFAMALALQWVQQFTPERVPALYDAFFNLLGLTVGLVVGALIAGRRYRTLVPGGLRRVATTAEILIAGCWLGYRLFPFVPSLDWQQIKDSLKPLLLHPDLSFAAILDNTAGWALFFLLLSPRLTKPYPTLLVLAPLTLLAEVLVVDNSLSVANLLGVAMATLLVLAIPPRSQTRVMILVLLCSLLIKGILPFAFTSRLNDFSWFPLSAFFSGSLSFNIQSLLQKLFFYGGLVLMLNRAGLGLYPASVAASLWLLLIECAQIFLRHHSPEITDPLIPLLVVFMLKSMSKPSTRLRIEAR